MKLSRIGSLLVAGLTCLPALAQEGGAPPPPPPTPPPQGQPEGQGGAQGQGEGGGQGGGQGEGRRGRGGRGGGGFGRGMNLPVEQMKEALGLSDEQVAQLQALNAELRTKGEELRELFQSGDFETARAKMQELRGELEKRRDEILTPEQRTKFQEQMQQFGRRFMGGEEGGPGGRGGRGRGNNKVRLREEAVKALALTPEEQAVVMPLLDAVLDTRELLQREGDERRDGFLKKVRETTDQQALATLLAEYRTARDKDGETLKQSSAQLREVLTVEQEAKLVGLNILD